MRRIFARFAALPAAIVLLAAVWALPVLAASQGDFTVVNNTSIVLTHLFVGPSDSADWGDDILGQDVLNPSESANVTFSKFDSSYCLYDVKVLGSQGQTGQLLKVDLCTVTSVTFSDSN
jgi:hypothetical protein